MALRNEDRTWVEAQIKAALRPQGFNKFSRWLREWGLVGVIITAFLALCGIVVTLGIFTSNHLEKNARFEQRTEDFETQTGARLTKIEATLLELEVPNSPAKALRNLSEASPKTFAAALPALRKVTELPFSEVSPSKETLQNVAGKLRHVEVGLPDYWATVLRYIKFASAGLSPNVPPPGPPRVILSRVVSTYPRGIKIGPLKHTIVLLDGGELWNVTFEHCRIIFTQQPVIMHNFVFIDCVFELPTTMPPSQYLKDAAQTLLASNLQRVQIGNLGAASGK